MDRIFYSNEEYAKYSDKFLKRFNLADQAAYDALPAATKNDDSKVFFIPDEPDYIYKWDFTKSLTDEIEGSEVTLGANAIRTSSGVSFTGKGDRIIFDNSIDIMINKTIEIDIANCDFKGNTSYDMNFLIIPTSHTKYSSPLSFLKSKQSWGVYYKTYSSIESRELQYNAGLGRNYFNDSKIKIKTIRTPHPRYNYLYSFQLYVNDTLIGTVQDCDWGGFYLSTYGTMTIGGGNVSPASNGDQCYDMTITGVRIYDNEEEE